MAETVVTQQSDLAAGLSASATQKRKRGTEAVSSDTRRTKRGAPAAAMSNHLEAAAAFMEPTGMSAEFSALQQATSDHPDAADPANASSTAAAALGSMYPTLHVPQPTEETFAAQAAAGADAYPASEVGHPDGLPGLDSVGQVQQGANGIRQEARYQPPMSGPKPAVGSEEWHKMRKDNHKEGRWPCRNTHICELDRS